MKKLLIFVTVALALSISNVNAMSYEMLHKLYDGDKHGKLTADATLLEVYDGLALGMNTFGKKEELKVSKCNFDKLDKLPAGSEKELQDRLKKYVEIGFERWNEYRRKNGKESNLELIKSSKKDNVAIFLLNGLLKDKCN